MIKKIRFKNFLILLAKKKRRRKKIKIKLLKIIFNKKVYEV